MKRIFYASGSFLTSDAIADALLSYADALAHSYASDVVDFPIVLPNGSIGTASTLIGPASQVASATEVSELPEPDDEGLVEELERRIKAIGTPRPVVQPANEIDIKPDYE